MLKIRGVCALLRGQHLTFLEEADAAAAAKIEAEEG